MPNVNANAILAAMEGDEVVQVTPSVPEAAPAVVPSTQSGTLSQQHKETILMMLLREGMGKEQFAKYVAEHKTELQVYGFYHDADELQKATSSLQPEFTGVLESAAIMLAKLADSPAMEAYRAAVEAENNAIAAIMETYGEPAKQLIMNIIDEYKTISNGPDNTACLAISSCLNSAAGYLA